MTSLNFCHSNYTIKNGPKFYLRETTIFYGVVVSLLRRVIGWKLAQTTQHWPVQNIGSVQYVDPHHLDSLVDPFLFVWGGFVIKKRFFCCHLPFSSKSFTNLLAILHVKAILRKSVTKYRLFLLIFWKNYEVSIFARDSWLIISGKCAATPTFLCGLQYRSSYSTEMVLIWRKKLCI